MTKVLAISVLIGFAGTLSAAPNDGAYLVRIAGCADCHSPSADQPYSGGLRFDTDFGVFFSPNITPDTETGIGRWTYEDFRTALHKGYSPDGQYFYPVFPFRSYAKIRDRDLKKMWDYLRGLTPVHQPNRPHQLGFPYDMRRLLLAWRELFFGTYSSDPEVKIRAGSRPFLGDPNRSEAWNRGAYLVEAFAHCAECHTPRNRLGGLRLSKWMAGADQPLNGRIVPNITPDWLTGTGSWTKEDWSRFLAAGIDPEGKFPGGEMALVIQNTSALTEADRAAIVEYIMSLPPVRRGDNAPP